MRPAEYDIYVILFNNYVYSQTFHLFHKLIVIQFQFKSNKCINMFSNFVNMVIF